MTFLDLLLWLLAGLGVLIGFPILCYAAAKFGTAGYLRAKQREKQKKEKHHETTRPK